MVIGRFMMIKGELMMMMMTMMKRIENKTDEQRRSMGGYPGLMRLKRIAVMLAISGRIVD